MAFETSCGKECRVLGLGFKSMHGIQGFPLTMVLRGDFRWDRMASNLYAHDSPVTIAERLARRGIRLSLYNCA